MELWWFLVGIVGFYLYQIISFTYRRVKSVRASNLYYILSNIINGLIVCLTIPFAVLAAAFATDDTSATKFAPLIAFVVVTIIPFLFLLFTLIDAVYFRKISKKVVD